LKAATASIPIVFFVAADPVALGLVDSLNRPGANLTGTTINPTSPSLANVQTQNLQAAARSRGLQIEPLRASNDSEVDAAFAEMTALRVDGLVISADSFLFSRKERLAELAARDALPAIFGFREFAVAGGLISYGASPTEQHRIVGHYIGRILNGEKPANLPVQQSTKVELIVNLKTAKTLGLNIPLPILGRADEAIE
jgi:ABC-type uncharacterized transport system substrate-binding protein